MKELATAAVAVRPAGPGEPAAVGLSREAERARLAALARYEVLDTPPEAAFDDICELAAGLFHAPTALVSLVDEGRQWFKARLGMDICETGRDVAFCVHALATRQVLVVPDATLDPRFADNPLVTGPPGIRFYAGAPLLTQDGQVLGTLCVIDTVPRTFSPTQAGLLEKLARQVMTLLEHRRQAHALAAEVAAREVAEAAHAETRRVLDGVLEHTDLLVFAKDLDGRFLVANHALHALLGVADGQAVGRDDHDLFPADEARTSVANDRAVAAGGRPQVLREALTHPDGTVHSYLSTRFPLRDSEERVYAVAGVSTDVTELERARTELADSQRRWQALVESSPGAVAVYDVDDLAFRYANPPAARLYGADGPKDLIGTSFLDLFAPTERSACLQRLARMLAGETVLGEHAWIVGRDGHRRDVEIQAGLVTWDGRPAVQCEMRDVTARVAADLALRASEERFRTLFTTAPIGIIEALPDGVMIAVNPQICHMLGYSTHELVGRHVTAITDATQHADVGARLPSLQAPGGGASYHAERTYLRKDGTAVPVLVSVAAVRGPDGHAQRLVGSVVDVTALVRAEQRATRTAADLAERQTFTDALLDTVEVGIVACGADGHLTAFNTAARLWHGLEPDAELDPVEFARHYDVCEADGVTPLAADRTPLLVALTEGQVFDREMVIAPRDLPPTRVLCSGQVLRDERGHVLGAVVAMHDITLLRAGQESLRESAAFHDAVLAASPDLIFVSDPEADRILWSSRSLMDMLGYTLEQVRELGPDLVALTVHPDDAVRLHAANTASRGLGDGEVLQIRYRVKHSDGHYRWLSRRSTPFHRDTDGQVVQVLSVATDVTELVQVEERLTEAALHDPLTGLPNRTLLSDRLGLALRRTSRTGQDVAVLFCDLDGFKHVNDTAGHAAGDAVLMAAAGRLREVLRPQDTVARVGGDEFVVVLESVARSGSTGRDADREGADRGDPRQDVELVARRIKQALAAPVQFDGVAHSVTVSIGVTFARSGDDPDEALRDADSAMYRAKSRGKNRHEVFETSLRADAVERGRVERVLRAALHHLPGRPGPRPTSAHPPTLGLAYQPIVDLGRQCLAGVEALARLTDDAGLPINPDVFIPIAEETGLIASVGRYVLDTACADLAGWHARHPAYRGLGVSVNLSARQAGLADLVGQVHRALERNRLAPGALTLELTESVLLEAGRSTTTALTELCRLGVKVSIDDFGTGYASLRYLTQLPVIGVKVDQSFTRGLPNESTSSAIVQVVAALADQLGLDCVVEGIETDEQLLALPTGVLGQGFLLGRPVPAEDLDRALADRRNGPGPA